MLTISLLILIAFLIVRVAIGAAQRFMEGRARGRTYRRMLHQGRIDADVHEEASQPEADCARGRSRVRMSGRQRRAVQQARLEMREDFLNDHVPGLYQCVIIFLVASVLGLVLETVYTFIVFGVVESRVGLVWGPFSPLYGVGAVVLTLVLWPLRHERTVKLFVLSAAIGGVLEQTAGWSMEHFAHLQSWTYLGLPDHITPWVAWRFLVMWGVLGVVWCRVIMPEIMYRIGEPTTRRQVVVVSLLAAFIVVDVILTVACFWRAGQRVEGIPPSNAFEAYIDTHFDDRFMERTFENMTIGEDVPPSSR